MFGILPPVHAEWPHCVHMGWSLAIVGLAASFCLLLRGSGGRPRGNRTPWVCWRLEHLCTGRIHWNTAIMCDFMVFISSSRPTGDCGIWKMIDYSMENLRYGRAVLFWVKGKAWILSGVLARNSKVFLWHSALLLQYVRPVGLDSLDWLRAELKTIMWIMVFSIWYQYRKQFTNQSPSTNDSVSSFFHHLNWQPTHLRKNLVEVWREVSQHTTEPPWFFKGFSLWSPSPEECDTFPSGVLDCRPQDEIEYSLLKADESQKTVKLSLGDNFKFTF